MKRNITINMFGQLYAIDEDAYNLLKCYIDSMKRYFAEKDGGEEIADDIEHRVAELLWQTRAEGAEAINIDIVKDIICKIGNPAEIDGGDGEAYGEEAAATEGQEAESDAGTARGRGLLDGLKGRYLYRDPNDKILGGVCAGLAAFTGQGSSLLWRLGVIVVMFFSFSFSSFADMPLFLFIPVVYIIMWIIVPLPNTPEDRLRMKGQSVTPKNINEEIISEMEGREDTVPRMRSNNGGCLSLLLKVALVMCLLPFFLAFGFLLLLLLFVLSVMVGASTAMFPLLFDSGHGWMGGFLDGNSITMAVGLLGAFIVIGLPLYCIIRGLRGNMKNVKASGMMTYVLIWIVGLCVAIFCSISIAMNASQAESDYLDKRYGDWAAADTVDTQDPLAVDSVAVDTVGWSE